MKCSRAQVGAAFLLVLSGCGGGSSTSTGTTGATTSTSTGTTTGAGGATTSSTTGSGGSAVTTGSGGAGGATTTTGAGGTGGAGTTTGAGAGGSTTTTGTGGTGGAGGSGMGGAGTTTGTGGAGGAGTTTGAGGSPTFCVPGSTQACYTGPAATRNVGSCKDGMATCDAMGAAYGACIGETLPQPEMCATPADVDCDGSTPPCGGTTLWSKVVGDTLDDEGAAIALDPAGNLLFGGYTTGVSQFGCGNLDAGPNNSGVVVKLAADGTCLWNKSFGSAVVGNISEIKALAVDAAGNVFVLGYIVGTVDLGGGPLTSTTPGESDVVLAKLSPNGTHLWSKRFGGIGNQYARGAAVDAQGNIVIVGYFFNTIDFGGGVLNSTGATDVYVAKFNPMGNHLWSKRYGNVSGQEAFGVAIDGGDNIVLAGTLKGTMDFGGGARTSAGLGDVFIAKLTSAGAHVWSQRFGDAQDQTCASVAVDPAGNVIAGGGFTGTINFGGGNVVSQGGTDAWLVKLSPAGAFVWGRVGGGTNNQTFSGVSVDPQGNVAATGFTSDTADFGGGGLVSAGGQDVVVARYDPTGAHLWSKSYGSAATEVGRGATSSPAGEVFITGLVMGPTDFGGGAMVGGGGEDIFLVKLAP